VRNGRGRGIKVIIVVVLWETTTIITLCVFLYGKLLGRRKTNLIINSQAQIF